MSYVFAPRPRWPPGREPLNATRSKRGSRGRWPYVLRQRVRGRSGYYYTVHAQQRDAAGWAFNVVEPETVDMWCSYLSNRETINRLVIDVYFGPRCTAAERDQVLQDFGLLTTLRASNV